MALLIPSRKNFLWSLDDTKNESLKSSRCAVSDSKITVTATFSGNDNIYSIYDTVILSRETWDTFRVYILETCLLYVGNDKYKCIGNDIVDISNLYFVSGLITIRTRDAQMDHLYEKSRWNKVQFFETLARYYIDHIIPDKSTWKIPGFMNFDIDRLNYNKEAKKILYGSPFQAIDACISLIAKNEEYKQKVKMRNEYIGKLDGYISLNKDLIGILKSYLL